MVTAPGGMLGLWGAPRVSPRAPFPEGCHQCGFLQGGTGHAEEMAVVVSPCPAVRADAPEPALPSLCLPATSTGPSGVGNPGSCGPSWTGPTA